MTDTAQRTDEELVRDALRRLNPEFHESDISWPSLDAIVAERDSLRARVEAAEGILRKATAPRRPDGTYNFSREAFEQMANDYFAVVVPVEKQPR